VKPTPLVLMLALVGGTALADEGRIQVEQRMQLTSRLMADSRTSERITASGNPQAVAHFDEGRLHFNMAEEAFKAGDLASARKQVDEALRHLGLARRLAPDAPARQAAARQRHNEMLASVERLIDSWRSRAGPEQASDSDLVSAIGLVGTARSMGDSARYEESVRALTTAQAHVLTGMTRVLHAREIDYTMRASTPAEEYQLELQRLQSLTELVPLAMTEMRPKGEALALMERYGENSRAARAQAEAAFQGGDVRQALAHVRSASLFLQRALGAAGVITPTATGSLQ